jgi:hypothetical protein
VSRGIVLFHISLFSVNNISGGKINEKAGRKKAYHRRSN